MAKKPKNASYCRKAAIYSISILAVEIAIFAILYIAGLWSVISIPDRIFLFVVALIILYSFGIRQFIGRDNKVRRK